MKRFRSVLACAILVAAAFSPAAPPQARGQEAVTGDAAVEQGRQALRDSRYPWYDSQADDLRRVDVRPDRSAENLNRRSEWQSKPPPTWTAPTTNFGWLGSLMRALGIAVGVALFGLLIWLLVWAFLRREASTESQAGGGVDAEDPRGDIDRIENLPFQVKRPQSNLLGEAQRNYQEGNYREAIIYLFSYQLVQLDRHQIIRLTKGKTNRQYLREVRQRGALFPIVETTMIAFEDVFFGDHTLSRGEFETCWNSLDEFHRLIELPQQVAA